MASYPIAKKLPPETSRLDLLIYDDEEMFPGHSEKGTR